MHGLGSKLIKLRGMATDMIARYKESPAERVGIPVKGFDAGDRNHIGCPSDRSDLHGWLCRKTLKDIYLPAVLLRATAQI